MGAFIAFRSTIPRTTALAELMFLLGNDDQLTKIYGIEGYPSKIIVIPEGVVVGKYLGEGTEFYAEMDRLFKQ